MQRLRGREQHIFSIIILIGLLLVIFLLPGCTKLPQAGFIASVTSGTVPCTVSFDNTSKNADEFRWDFGDGTTMTTITPEQPVTHNYTMAGTHTVTLTAVQQRDPAQTDTITLTVTIEHGFLSSVKLTPEMVEVVAGQSHKLTAQALDIYNNPIPEAQIIWGVAEGVGTISSSGVLTATEAGSYLDGVTVTAELNNDSVEATAPVTVKHGFLDSVTLNPTATELATGQSQKFTAEAVDAYDNPIPEAQITWAVTEGVGTISSTGILTSGINTGVFHNGVVVTAELSGDFAESTALVTVYVLREITSLVGDKDGFGLGLVEGDKRASADVDLLDNREPDDPIFTDILATEQIFSYEHNYDLAGGTIVSAELNFFTLGVQDGDTQVFGMDTDIRLFLDGVEVENAFDDLDQFMLEDSTWVELAGSYTISIPESILSVLSDGNTEVRIEILELGDTANAYDAIAIDFSELIIVTRTPPPVDNG